MRSRQHLGADPPRPGPGGAPGPARPAQGMPPGPGAAGGRHVRPRHPQVAPASLQLRQDLPDSSARRVAAISSRGAGDRSGTCSNARLRPQDRAVAGSSPKSSATPPAISSRRSTQAGSSRHAGGKRRSLPIDRGQSPLLRVAGGCSYRLSGREAVPPGQGGWPAQCVCTARGPRPDSPRAHPAVIPAGG